MRRQIRTCIAAVLLVLAGCASPVAPQAPVTVTAVPDTVTATPMTVTATTALEPTLSRAPVTGPPATTTAAASTASANTAIMPEVVCQNLQDAQDEIQRAGVFFSRSDDASGQARSQIIDRNWIVVAQTPAAGSSVGEMEAILSVVKDGEPNNC